MKPAVANIVTLLFISASAAFGENCEPGYGDFVCQGEHGLTDNLSRYWRCVVGWGNGGCPGTHSCVGAAEDEFGYCCPSNKPSNAKNPHTICDGRPAEATRFLHSVTYQMCKPSGGPTDTCASDQKCVSNDDGDWGFCCPLYDR